MKIIFDEETAVDDELKQFLLKADQHGKWMMNIFVKYIMVPCPLCILIESVASVIYSQLRYGFIDPNVLFRPYTLMYGIPNEIILFQFENKLFS